MKTYRDALTLALSLAFLVTFTGLAGAQDHNMQGHNMQGQSVQGQSMQGHGMMGGGMNALTPEQQATMQKLHAEHAAATAELRKQIFAKESELDAQIYGEKPDEAKIDALTKDIGALNAKLYTERVKLHRQLAKEGIMPMGGAGCGMMAGKGGMMGGGMKMHGGMGGMNCPMMNGMNANTNAPAQTPTQTPAQ